jgi:hypothetical protein
VCNVMNLMGLLPIMKISRNLDEALEEILEEIS